METRKVVIIGSGPAGYTAAIYAARANLEPGRVRRRSRGGDPRRVPGGQLMITTEVENYPGFPEGVTGPELMERFQKQAERFGTTVHMENVRRGRLLASGPSTSRARAKEVLAQTLIIATGASAKWLGVKGEDEFMNRGVSACATCDGFFFKGKDVLVVGGGDTAMEEATYLTKMCASVTVVHRRDSCAPRRSCRSARSGNPKITFVWDSAVEEIVGDAEGRHGRGREEPQDRRRDAAARGEGRLRGHRPQAHHRAVQGRAEAAEPTATSGSSRARPRPASRACSPRRRGRLDYRQAITAAGTGCMAAIEAERWMTEHGLV